MEFLLDSNRKMEVDIINIKLDMSSFSRKLVLLFAIIFWQSSLGTNTALKDFSNVSTKNFSQNGYYKLPDGLMIQWGKKAGGSSYQGTITLPLSFHDDYYSLACSAMKGNLIDLSSWVINYLAKTKSSFNYICTYAAEGNGNIFQVIMEGCVRRQAREGRKKLEIN